ncbi:MAG: YlmC/YmxH family sporulation protein [Firmicutes bacterium]|nr:YlmC/YmxH family sporulation protein [Bacillota bacterium]HOB34489.1 YlmC/YmxH family sporulation protein [Bacillota bacterium]HPZ90097.1 YlmC/YmxH family sporulation protein [Bacillota bacterium]HQE01043.1 YlmC/YmxH family sporulation protein [Bacillota bacterium]
MQVVRFSDLAAKEVINFGTGRCLGTFADCDMRIDPDTGKILEVILAGRSGLLAMFFNQVPVHVIPWEAIMRIGLDAIIISLEGEKKS